MPGDRLLRDNIPVPLRTLDILDYKSDAVCVFDRDWRFAYASSPAVTLARVPGEKLMGGNLWELFPKVAGSALETSFRATMGDGTHRRVEYFHEPYEPVGGNRYLGHSRGTGDNRQGYQSSKESRPRRSELVSALQREQERLRLSEERFRIALNNSPIAVFNQDANLTYTWLYNALEEFREIEWVGKSDEVAGESAAEVIRLKKIVLQTGKGIRREMSAPPMVRIATSISIWNRFARRMALSPD